MTMKMPVYLTIAIWVVMLPAAFLMAADGPATRPTIHDRIVNTLQNMSPGLRPQAFSNIRVEFRDRIRAVKRATEQSLQRPLVTSALCWPQDRKEDGTVPALVTWLEDRPSLKEVVVTNPETRKQQRISIPQSRLDEAIKDEAPYGVVYGELVWISAEVAGANPAQVLDVVAEGQAEFAHCYPSITVAALGEPAHASTAPSTQGSGR